VLQEGQIFAGRYRVGRRIAQGGMGAIFAAEHLSTEERVALKVLWPHVLSSQAAVESFQLEARVTARIGSEAIVRVLDAGFDEQLGVPFLAMELLRGITLRALVDGARALAPAEALAVLRQVAGALDKAHGHVDRDGRPAPIVHRDLKPDNLFLALRDEGEVAVKVLDFGIAKVLSESQRYSHEVRGTPSFMACEQFERGPVTPQLDLWAFGLVAFYLLTGETYWLASGQGPQGLTPLLNEVLLQPLVPPGERAIELGLTPAWPAAFDDWFLRCVHREPKARFASAGEAVTALRAALGSGAGLADADVDAARLSLGRKVSALLGPPSALPPPPRASGSAAAPTETLPRADLTASGTPGDIGASPPALPATLGPFDDPAIANATTLPQLVTAGEAPAARPSPPARASAASAAGDAEPSEVAGALPPVRVGDPGVSPPRSARGDESGVSTPPPPTADEVTGASRSPSSQGRAWLPWVALGGIALWALAGLSVMRGRYAQTTGVLASAPLVASPAAPGGPPPDPAARAEIRAISADLAAAGAHLRSGEYRLARELANASFERASRAAHAPSRAEALELRGRAEMQLGDFGAAEATFGQAVLAAGEARAEGLEARAQIGLAFVLAELNKFEAAHGRTKRAGAIAGRVPGAGPIEVERLSAEGWIFFREGKYDRAEALLREGLAAAGRLPEPDPESLAILHNRLGNTLSLLHRFEEALDHLEREDKLITSTRGADHPERARNVADRGNVLLEMRRYDDAIAAFTKALTFRPGPGGPRAILLGNLGEASEKLGKYREASEWYEQALQIASGASSPQTWLVGVFKARHGRVLSRLGRVQEGLELCEEGLRLEQASLPADHFFIAEGLECVGTIRLRSGLPGAAVQHLERALAIREGQADRENSAAVRALLGEARAAARGR
jgi:tetratricopeptide (TPR) repeat protein